MEKTRVSKADSDEKSPRFSEKSPGNFWWFPYGTSDEKVSHSFLENFPKIFPSEFFWKFPEFPKSFLTNFFGKVSHIFFEKKKSSWKFFCIFKNIVSSY